VYRLPEDGVVSPKRLAVNKTLYIVCTLDVHMLVLCKTEI